jgi:hypothetical protein
MDSFSTKYIVLVSVAIIAGNALHRWVVMPALIRSKFL